MCFLSQYKLLFSHSIKSNIKNGRLYFQRIVQFPFTKRALSSKEWFFFFPGIKKKLIIPSSPSPPQLLTLMFNYVSRIGPFWSAVLWVLTNVDSWVPPPRKCRAQFLPRERFSRVPSLWWSSICYCPYSFDFARISYRWNHSEFSLLSLAYSAWLYWLCDSSGLRCVWAGSWFLFLSMASVPLCECATVCLFIFRLGDVLDCFQVLATLS